MEDSGLRLLFDNTVDKGKSGVREIDEGIAVPVSTVAHKVVLGVAHNGRVKRVVIHG